MRHLRERPLTDPPARPLAPTPVPTAAPDRPTGPGHDLVLTRSQSPDAVPTGGTPTGALLLVP